jgi:glutathione S-transferase
MSLTFYYGSGSPPAWRVWLALEHKGIPYEAVRISFDKREHKTPEFLKLNSRGKVPTIVHDGWPLGESGAILEYLDEVWPAPALLPKAAQARAIVRRLAREAEQYLGEAVGKLTRQTLMRPKGDGDPAEIASARTALATELAHWEAQLTGQWLAGELSLADFTAYPSLRMLRRIGERLPQHSADDLVGPRVAGWMGRIEALPYYAKTIPPHWKE